jgi:3',5'-cyclic AMP phosphodiesterase CpdA
LEVPLHNTIGNHDVFGLFTKSGVSPTDEKYGKKMFEDTIGRRYYSFDHKGWHFVVLDSIGMTPERQYIGQIDDDQLTWLTNDLQSTGTSVPVVLITHIPLVSTFPQMVSPPGASTAGILVTNVRDVLKIMMPYKVKAVLQGHTHVCENVRYKDTQFITSGAVSGNWWRGHRLGFPEGFAVLTVKGEEISWRYETYGWQAAAGT